MTTPLSINLICLVNIIEPIAGVHAMRRIGHDGPIGSTALPHPGTASLPMYDFDELRAAHDTLWSAIAAQLADRSVPLVLSHATDVHALWHAPDLVLSQACGWP